MISRQVDLTEFSGGGRVSTVLLTNGQAFETLVFDKNGTEIFEIQTKSRNQAEENHKAAVRDYFTIHNPS